ncbi:MULTISPECIES: TolC family protein [unclassified Cupriavidus]|uniref:TolC family protein n=1 Tax=unclassified Cupriavidus TaxID=2640874 RepID=UPI00313EC833
MPIRIGPIPVPMPVPMPALSAASVAAFVAAFVAALTAGCSTAPVYQRPTMTLPTAYRETYAGARSDYAQASATPAHPGGPSHIAPEWWRAYGDKDLDALEARVDITSQTVIKAVALLQDARTQVSAARSQFYPTVGAGASVTSNHLSANVRGHSLAGHTTPDHALGITASWEPDLFGRIRNEVDAAQARVDASADDVAAVRLGVQADIAIDYLAIRSLDREAGLLTRTIDTYQAVLDLVTNRYRNGIAIEGDVAQSRAQLASTRAQLADVQLSRTQIEHALATLLGESASTFSLPARADAKIAHDMPTFGTTLDCTGNNCNNDDLYADIAQMPAAPRAVPSQLLERRPDIAAAERRVAAANADIGVARAAFFPDLMLNLGLGFESSGLAGWLTAPSRFWAVGPAIAGTLFDGGRRQAGEDSAYARFDASAADYRQTVLRAMQEVEDGYASVQALRDATDNDRIAADASAVALRAGLDRYRLGAVSYLDVSVLQANALADARALESVRRRAWTANVLLVKSLGGGWRASNGEEPSPHASNSSPSAMAHAQ